MNNENETEDMNINQYRSSFVNMDEADIKQFGSNKLVHENVWKSASFPKIENSDPNQNKIHIEQNNLDALKDIPYAKEEEKFSRSEMKGLLENLNIFREKEIKLEYSIIEDDYLPLEEFAYDLSHINREYNSLIKDFDFSGDLQMLKNTIVKVKLNVVHNASPMIGPVSSLDYLVESSFNSDESRRKSIMDKMVSLEDIVYTWRKVGGDGNCFYRAVVFAYFETLILCKDVELLKFLIVDIQKKFNHPYLNSKLKSNNVKKDLVLKILVLIYSSMEDVSLAYDLLVKCFNTCKHFDFGLIFYFRFKMYEFIKENEDKLYTKDFSVKLGNLLPSEYETEEGKFLFDKFYEGHLMKLYKDAEKIVIYLTPFVLKINLNILVYDFGTSCVENLKEFPFCLNPESRKKITLLYKKTHYDLIYTKDYFDFHMKYLTQFVHLGEDLKVITSSLLEEVKKIKSKKGLIQEDQNIATNDESTDYSNINMLNLTGNTLNKLCDKTEKESDRQTVNQHFNTDDGFINNKTKNNIVDINFLPSIGCLICKKAYIPFQTVIRLCKDCLYNEIKSDVLSKHLHFMQASRGNFFFKGVSTDADLLFKIHFQEASVKILDESYPPKDIFRLINSDFNSFYYSEIKPFLCSNCDKSIDTKQSTLSLFTLPCNCVICSHPECLQGYLTLLFRVDPRDRRKDFVCICSANYTKSELKRLFHFLHSNNCKTSKEKLVDVYKQRALNLCMLCLEERSSEGFLRDFQPIICDLKDAEVESTLKKQHFSHIICTNCINEQFDPKLLSSSKALEIKGYHYCMICDSVHYLNSIRVSRSEKITMNSGCLIN